VNTAQIGWVNEHADLFFGFAGCRVGDWFASVEFA
jgi:hypothetical protein